MSEGLKADVAKDGYVVNTKPIMARTEFKVILKLLPAADGGQIMLTVFIYY